MSIPQWSHPEHPSGSVQIRSRVAGSAMPVTTPRCMPPAVSLLLHTGPGWLDRATAVAPGAHVAVLTRGPSSIDVAVAGRSAGLHLRDTLLVLRPGPLPGFVLLFRRPAEEATILEQVGSNGAGALDIAHSRHPAGRWPPNVLLVHGPECVRRGRRRLSQATGTRDPRLAVRSRPSLGFYEDGSKRKRVTDFKNVEVPHFNYGDEDGFERVDDWECQRDCSVRLIDTNGTEQAHYYIHFKDDEELGGWLLTLMTPPTFSSSDPQSPRS